MVYVKKIIGLYSISDFCICAFAYGAAAVLVCELCFVLLYSYVVYGFQIPFSSAKRVASTLSRFVHFCFFSSVSRALLCVYAVFALAANAIFGFEAFAKSAIRFTFLAVGACSQHGILALARRQNSKRYSTSQGVILWA
jgi:hypothetical protein